MPLCSSIHKTCVRALWLSNGAVVGVHGGALSNILFCQPGTTVIELTIDSPFARHYAHAAAALQMPFVGVPGPRRPPLDGHGLEVDGHGPPRTP